MARIRRARFAGSLAERRAIERWAVFHLMVENLRDSHWDGLAAKLAADYAPGSPSYLVWRDTARAIAEDAFAAGYGAAWQQAFEQISERASKGAIAAGIRRHAAELSTLVEDPHDPISRLPVTLGAAASIDASMVLLDVIGKIGASVVFFDQLALDRASAMWAPIEQIVPRSLFDELLEKHYPEAATTGSSRDA